MKQHQGWQFNSNNLSWLLLALTSLVLLHASYLPLWVCLMALAALVWRFLHYRGRVAFPGRRVKLLFVLATCGGLLIQYPTPIGLEPMLTLLMAGYALKLLEMNSRRDLILLVYLGYFSAAAACIFSQEVAVYCAVLGFMVLNTACLVAANQSRAQAFGFRPFRQSMLLLATSIPLMIVLFMVMPRLGAMWSLPGPKNQGVTGISNSMSPGDFTRLGKSAKVAFRVQFDGSTPERQQLYWRGLVLSKFDGRTWSQSSFSGSHTPLLENELSNPDIVRYQSPPLSYRLTMEPTYERWVFTLPLGTSNDDSLVLTRDLRLVSKPEIYARKSYQMQSWLDYALEPDILHSYRYRLETSLPQGYNPETVRVARLWAEQAPNPEQLIQRVLQLFNRSFVYTLQPPSLGKHSVDEFLWQTRQGFCEHFASSFVFFMRAAGYPARVVAGYQGGEVHPTEGFLTVRQYDAHAWAEVWLQGQGWVRIDPTAAVAPERIRDGFSRMFEEDEAYLADTPLSLVRFQRIGVINWLRLKLESLDYAWATWVLGYDQIQYEFLSRLLGRLDALKIALFLLAGASVAMLPLLLMTWRDRIQQGNRHPLDRIYLAFCKKAKKAGFSRRTGEGSISYGERLAAQFPRHEVVIRQFCSRYTVLRFSGKPLNAMEIKSMKRTLRKLTFLK